MDSFNNHFRRNRRFLAKSKYNDVNASRLLFENYIRNHDKFEDNSYTAPSVRQSIISSYVRLSRTMEN